MSSAAPAARPRLLLFALGLLSAFGPLSMDLYLPGLPSLVEDFGSTDAVGQATMSASMIGLALGQLLLGPLSDRFGRRRPLLIGVGAFAVLSVLCAVSPTVEVLILVRLAQGLAGSAGIVICRAVVRDLFSQTEAARAFALLAAVVGIAPVIAPLLGGGLLLIVDWRGLFVALAVIGVLLFALAWAVVPDTLAPENRHVGGAAEQLRDMGRILRDRRFLPAALALATGALGLFSYISMGPLVLQGDYGLSPQAYSVVLAVNAVGIVTGAQISRRLAGRVSVRTLAIGSVGIGALSSSVLVVFAAVGLPLPALLIALFCTVFVHGSILANITALALAPFARGAGAASALLGMFQFSLGALVPPLASLGGTSALLMASCMAGGLLASLALLMAGTRSGA